MTYAQVAEKFGMSIPTVYRIEFSHCTNQLKSEWMVRRKPGRKKKSPSKRKANQGLRPSAKQMEKLRNIKGPTTYERQLWGCE